MAVSVELGAEAVRMLKADLPPETVHAFLVSHGVTNDEAYVFVSDLVAMKRDASHLDPVKLRDEGKWMLLRGGTPDDVLRHFVSAGVAEEYARPEIAKIIARVAAMRPCQRCGTPTEQADLVFDLRGTTVCNRCNLQDEIGRSEQRGIASTLESVGFNPLLVDAIANAIPAQSAPQRAYCQYCRVPSGVHVSSLQPDVRARYPQGWSWVCGQCGQPIS